MKRDASACLCYGQAKHEANLISSGSKNTLLRMNCNGDFYSFLPLLNTPVKLRLGCDVQRMRSETNLSYNMSFISFSFPRELKTWFSAAVGWVGAPSSLSLIPLLSHYDRQIESVFLPRVFRRVLSPKRMNPYILSLSLARPRSVSGSRFPVCCGIFV